VRIPKEYQLQGDEVEIRKKGAALILRPKRASWTALEQSLKKFSDDFMKEGRKQPPARSVSYSMRNLSADNEPTAFSAITS
jgi:antitoxin VapB